MDQRYAAAEQQSRYNQLLQTQCSQQTAVFAKIPYLICVEMFQEIFPVHVVQAVTPLVQKAGPRLEK